MAVLAPRDPGERGLDLGLAQLRQAGAGGAVGGDGGQALLHVAVLLDVDRGHDRFEAGAGGGVEVAAGDQVVGQAPGLVAGPGLEGGDRAGPGRSGRSEARAIRRGDGGRRRQSWHGSEQRRSIGRRPQPRGPAPESSRVGAIIAGPQFLCIWRDPQVGPCELRQERRPAALHHLVAPQVSPGALDARHNMPVIPVGEVLAGRGWWGGCAWMLGVRGFRRRLTE